jgi:hypothetical protein
MMDGGFGPPPDDKKKGAGRALPRSDFVQHLYSLNPNSAPPNNRLQIGEIGIELADPMKIWVGVPVQMNATGRKLLYNSASVAGGPYLPLTAGPSNALTGDLYLKPVPPTLDAQATNKKYVDDADSWLQDQISAVASNLIFMGQLHVPTDVLHYKTNLGLPDSPLPDPTTLVKGAYVIVIEPGIPPNNGTTFIPPLPANTGEYVRGDWFISDGIEWVFLPLGLVYFTASAVATEPPIQGTTNVQQTLQWLYDNKLNLAGGQMTGPLQLSQVPTSNFMAAGKKYVDDHRDPGYPFLPLSGGVMSGGIQFSNALAAAGTPTDLSGYLDLWGGQLGFGVSAARLNYNVNAASAHVFLVGGSDMVSINTSGVSLAPNYTVLLGREPTADMEATPKQWVDAQIAAHGFPEPPFDGVTYGRQDNTWMPVLPLVAGLANKLTDSLYLDGTTTNKGATLNLTTPQWPAVVWNTTTDIKGSGNTAAGYFQSQRQGKNRWSVEFGGTQPEMGGNVGTNFLINRFDDAGQVLYPSPLGIVRGTGVVTIGTPLMLAGDPTAPLQAVPMQWVTANFAPIKDGGYVAKTGDTMTGPLEIAGTGSLLIAGETNELPMLVIDATNTTLSNPTLLIKSYGTQNEGWWPAINFDHSKNNGLINYMASLVDGITRWTFAFGDNAVESGNNTGTNFGLDRYDDLGNPLPRPLFIERSSGTVTIATPLMLGGDPTAPLQAVPKQYLDTNYLTTAQGDARWVNVTGDTMTGGLTVGTSTGTGGMIGLNGAAQSQYGTGLQWQAGGMARFQLSLDNYPAEDGTDIGSNLTFHRYGDTGAYLGSALSLDRKTGRVYTQAGLTLNGFGADFGSRLANGPLDMSLHISLFGGWGGFSVTGGSLNVIAGGQLALTFNGPGIDVQPGVSLYLSRDPVQPTEAVPKRYLDNNYLTIAQSDARYVNVTGDTMTGALTIGAGANNALTITQGATGADTITLAQSGTAGIRLPTIRVTAASAPLVVTDTAELPSIGAGGGALIRFLGSAASNVSLTFDAFGSGGAGGTAFFTGRGAQGSASAPSAMLANGTLVMLRGQGFGATSYGTGATIAMQAAQAWTDAARGAYMTFSTAPLGTNTVTERLRIDASGIVMIGQTVPLNAAKLQVNGGVSLGEFEVAGDYDLSKHLLIYDGGANHQYGLNVQWNGANPAHFNYVAGTDGVHQFLIESAGLIATFSPTGLSMSLNHGIDFGTTLAANDIDLSRHLSLFNLNHGINVSQRGLNVVAGASFFVNDGITVAGLSSGQITFNVGLSFGQRTPVSARPSDVSAHITLYEKAPVDATAYGFSVTGQRLNIVSPINTYFVNGGNDIGWFDANGLGFLGFYTATLGRLATADMEAVPLKQLNANLAGYLPLAGGTMQGSLHLKPGAYLQFDDATGGNGYSMLMGGDNVLTTQSTNTDGTRRILSTIQTRQDGAAIQQYADIQMVSGSKLFLYDIPTSDPEAASKKYVDGVITRAGGPFLPLIAGSGFPLTGPLHLQLIDPVLDQEATNKFYVDKRDQHLQDQIAVLTSNLVFVGQLHIPTDYTLFTPASGLAPGPLPLASSVAKGTYVIVVEPGSPPPGNIPPGTYVKGDWLVSDTVNWVWLELGLVYFVATEVTVTPPLQGTTNVDSALRWLDAHKLNLAGGTMTGQLYLSGLPTTGSAAASKDYVDSQIGGAVTSFNTRTGAVVLTPADVFAATGLLRTGGTMTGDLLLNSDPTADLGAATKQYVDRLNPANKYLLLTGGTMSGGISFGAETVASGNPTDTSRHITLWQPGFGFSITGNRLNYNVGATSSHVFLVGGADVMLINSGGIGMGSGYDIYLGRDPSQDMHAVNKRYVDASLSGYLKLTGGNMTGDILMTNQTRVNFFNGSMFIGSTGLDRADIMGANLEIGSWHGVGFPTTCPGQLIPHGTMSGITIGTREGYLEGVRAAFTDGRPNSNMQIQMLSIYHDSTPNQIIESNANCYTPTLASIVNGGGSVNVDDRFRDDYGNTYTAMAVSGGGVTSLRMDNARATLYGAGSNPVTLYAVSGSVAFNVSVNLTWTRPNFIILQHTYGSVSLYGSNHVEINGGAGGTYVYAPLRPKNGINFDNAVSGNPQDTSLGITFFGPTTGSNYGIVVTGSTLNYNVYDVTNKHDFYAGGNLLFRIQGNDAVRSFMPIFTRNFLQIDGAPGADAGLVLNSGSGGGDRLYAYNNGSLRWQIQFTGNDEGVGDTGSNFSLFSYGNDGHFIGQPLWITRNGDASFTGYVYVGKDPWQPTSAVTLRYLQANYSTTADGDARWVNVSGDTMSGALTVNANVTITGSLLDVYNSTRFGGNSSPAGAAGISTWGGVITNNISQGAGETAFVNLYYPYGGFRFFQKTSDTDTTLRWLLTMEPDGMLRLSSSVIYNNLPGGGNAIGFTWAADGLHPFVDGTDQGAYAPKSYVTTQLGNYVAKAGDTMSGALTVNSQIAVNQFGSSFSIYPGAGQGAWNGITHAGDTVLLFTNGSLDSGALTLTTWGNNIVGIRIDAAARTLQLEAASGINTTSQILIHNDSWIPVNIYSSPGVPAMYAATSGSDHNWWFGAWAGGAFWVRDSTAGVTAFSINPGGLGATFAGAVALGADPIASMEAVTLQYLRANYAPLVGGGYVAKSGDTMTGGLQITYTPTDTWAQLILGPNPGNAGTSNIRFRGTFGVGVPDQGPRYVTSIRSGFVTQGWGQEYLDIWITNQVNDDNSDAKQSRAARFMLGMTTIDTPFQVNNYIWATGNVRGQSLGTDGQIIMANNYAYFFERNGGNGDWRFVEGNTTIFKVDAGGSAFITANATVNGQAFFNGANPQVNIKGPVGTWRTLQFYTGEAPRWNIQAEASAEPGAGSNVGSDLLITRWQDDGSPAALVRFGRDNGRMRIIGIASDPLYIDVPQGMNARYFSTVTNIKTWSAGTFSNGHYAIGDENRSRTILTLDGSNGNATFDAGIIIPRGGINFGNRTGGSPTDLSQHLKLWDDGYGLSITGGTMNLVAGGVLNIALHGSDVSMMAPTFLIRDPQSAMEAATKQYVDGKFVPITGGNYVAKSGDTMTGPLGMGVAVPAAAKARTIQTEMLLIPYNNGGVGSNVYVDTVGGGAWKALAAGAGWMMINGATDTWQLSTWNTSTAGATVTGVGRLTFDGRGNLALGILAPQAHALGNGGNGGWLFGWGVTLNNWAQNAYYDGSNWRFMTNGYASQAQQSGGGFQWQSAGAVAGTKDDVCSMITRMMIDPAGNLTAYGNTTTTSLWVNGYLLQADSLLNFNSAAGKSRYIMAMSSSSLRWQLMIANNEAETGGNAGSNFSLSRFDDNQNYLGTPLSISRATGNVTISQTLVVNSGRAVIYGPSNPAITVWTPNYAGGMWQGGDGNLYFGDCDGSGVPQTGRFWIDRANGIHTGGRATINEEMNVSGIWRVNGVETRYMHCSSADAYWRWYESSQLNMQLGTDGTLRLFGSMFCRNGSSGIFTGGSGVVIQASPSWYWDWNSTYGHLAWVTPNGTIMTLAADRNVTLESGLFVNGGAIVCQSNCIGIRYISGAYATSSHFLFGWSNVVGSLATVSIDNGGAAYAMANASDERVKLDIQPCTLDALQTINRIPLASFDWLEIDDPWKLKEARARRAKSKRNPRARVGVIAQRVREVFPEGVYAGDDFDDHLGVVWGLDQNVMIALLIKSVQELSEQNTALMTRVTQLEQQRMH